MNIIMMENKVQFYICVRITVGVGVEKMYFDNEKHNIGETNTETFVCRSMSATNAYIENYK